MAIPVMARRSPTMACFGAAHPTTSPIRCFTVRLDELLSRTRIRVLRAEGLLQLLRGRLRCRSSLHDPPLSAQDERQCQVRPPA